MPVIKVTDMAYGKLRSPDLDAQEEFLTHFGMVRADRTKNALYMRGTDPAHHIHVTEKGDPGFIGIAYYAASEEDLHRVARVPGAPPATASTPYHFLLVSATVYQFRRFTKGHSWR